jgi:hypothetical protein
MSKLAAHVFEEVHRTDWKNIPIQQSESNFVYRKYKEPAHMFRSNNPISQLSMEICPVWFILTNKELKMKVSDAIVNRMSGLGRRLV